MTCGVILRTPPALGRSSWKAAPARRMLCLASHGGWPILVTSSKTLTAGPSGALRERAISWFKCRPQAITPMRPGTDAARFDDSYVANAGSVGLATRPSESSRSTTPFPTGNGGSQRFPTEQPTLKVTMTSTRPWSRLSGKPRSATAAPAVGVGGIGRTRSGVSLDRETKVLRLGADWSPPAAWIKPSRGAGRPGSPTRSHLM